MILTFKKFRISEFITARSLKPKFGKKVFFCKKTHEGRIQTYATSFLVLERSLYYRQLKTPETFDTQ